MRIRKRFPLSSPPLSDPQLNRSPVVQQNTIQSDTNHSQPSDPSNQPLLLRPHLSDHQLKIKPKEQEKAEKQDDNEEDGSNKPRKESNSSGVTTTLQTGFILPSSTSPQGDERWYTRDKAIPLKKRSYMGLVGEEMLMLEKEKKILMPKMKSKTNNSVSSGKGDMKSSTLMNKRGSAIMEGSRCSRVNGRGWRCCQQTLVGYSLCEHHLGKGRLRSINNASRANGASVISSRSKNIASLPKNDIKFERVSSLSSSSSSVVRSGCRDEQMLLDDCDGDDDNDDDIDDDYDDDEMKKKKPVLVKKKRMKIGMVKARSLSSLLNQTNNAVVVAAGTDWNKSD